MWILYILALLPILAGAIIWYFDEEINIVEWAIGSAVAFITAGIFHFCYVKGMLDDIETRSGQVINTRQYSKWKEYYEEAVYRTEYYTVKDSKGNSVKKSREVFDHWSSQTRWHEASWGIETTFRNERISETKHYDICKRFGDRHAVAGSRTTLDHNSKMIAGDPNDYVGENRTGWIEPITQIFHFENRIKASPSLFSFVKVPTNINVFNWPDNRESIFVSDRLLGNAANKINILKWDQMNSRLGPVKKVNVILIGFDSNDEMLGHWQQAKWIGGKKNDLVLVYGGNNNVTWSYVFGWTESEIVKKNLQTLLLKHPINDSILPLIEEEIVKNYKKKDWHRFDYITIYPKVSTCMWFLLILIVTQTILYVIFQLNDQSKFKFSKNFIKI